jgi:FkbM family methyltransferase
MIVRRGIVRRKLASLALTFFAKLENNGDAHFERNGEGRFLEALFRHLRKSGRARFVLVDVGANVGAYTRLLLERASLLKGKVEVHAFEPARESFEALRRGLSADGRVILNRKAASNVNGTASIFSDASHSTLASLHRRDLTAQGLNPGGTETVETIRLEDYLKTRAIDHVDFLKLDVEGHERAAVEGLGSYLSGERMDFVQFEYGGTYLDAHVSLREVYELFERAGFAVAKVMRHGLDVRPYQPWMDNFQYANYVAISRRIVAGLP